MSRASSYLPVLARHNNHTHPHPKHHHEPYNTQYFCALLEAGVEYMQTKHHQGQPFGVIDDDGDFLFQLREAIHAGRFYMLAVGVVLLYEYCITFDQEVELIWKRIKHCLVTPIFFLNRYVPLATYIFIVAGVQCANSDHEFCIGTFVRLPSALIVLCTVLIGIVRLILIWAFWKEDPKGKIFISGVLVTFMVQLSTSIACAVALQGIGPLYGRDPDKDQYGCFLVFQKGSMPRLIVHWFASMVFNILICYSIIKKLLAMPLFKATDNRDLAEVLLRDVKVMLFVIVMVHFTNLLMLVIFPYWNAVNWAFSSVADIILTSRILFNLRKTLASKTDMDECMPQLPLYKDLPPLPPPSPPSKRSSAFAGPSQDEQGQAIV